MAAEKRKKRAASDEGLGRAESGWEKVLGGQCEVWEAQLKTVKASPIPASPRPWISATWTIGHRLALWALAKVYNRRIVYSGPIYKSIAIEGEKIRIAFDYVGGGLVSRDGKALTEFVIAGAEKKFLPATAEIDGTKAVREGVARPAPDR